MMATYEPEFWGSWKGQVIKAIAIDGAKTWEEIRNLTDLSPDSLNIALSELYDLDILHKKSNGTYWVDRDIRDKYRKFFDQSRKTRTLEGDRMQVFVSYAFSDEGIMKKICEELHVYRIETYVAVHDLRPGESLPNKIEEAIQRSDATIVLLTRNSATSPSVNQELAFAKAKGKRIIPIVEKGVEIGVLLQGLERIRFEKEKIPQVSRKIAESLLKQRKGETVSDVSSENILVDETIVIPPEEYESYDFELEEGETLRINMSSDKQINLYIVDDGNYSRFLKDRDFEFEGRKNVKRCKITFTCEEEGPWTVVLDNTEGEDDTEVNIEIIKVKEVV